MTVFKRLFQLLGSVAFRGLLFGGLLLLFVVAVAGGLGAIYLFMYLGVLVHDSILALNPESGFVRAAAVIAMLLTVLFILGAFHLAMEKLGL